jgi:uncharacterized protein with FMN-binding domain
MMRDGYVLLRSYVVLSLVFVLLLAGNAAAQTSGSKKPKATPKSGGTRAQLDVLIEREGKTPPDWFKTTSLNYPQSLDLSWPERPEGGWNSQKNVGQFLWDVINPNPGRWREGVKLMHQLLTLHKDDPVKRERNMLTLGGMYHNLIEDYARAAFWYRAVGVEKDPEEYALSAVILAECYWRLGFTDEAKKFLEKVPKSTSHAKLLGDMGETDRAIEMALSELPDPQGYVQLTAGDACRQAGRYDEALKFYQQVMEIELPAKNPPGRLLKNRGRAQANIAAIRSFELFDLKKVPDGKYVASSLGYEAPIEVTVTVQRGRIDSVAVTKHREKQFYSAITDTPAKIIAKQHVMGVDTTSNATITSEAIVNATAKALAGEKK